MIDFNSKDPRGHFCEATMFYNHEYLNSFSSLFITISGIYGFIKNKSEEQDHEIYLVYSSLIINGIASFAYHWTNFIGWGLIDRITLILIAYPSMIIIIRETSFLYNVKQYISKISSLCVQIYFTTFIILCAIQYDDLFNIFFGIYFLYLSIFVVLIKHKKISIKNGVIGISCIIFGSIFWILTEQFCEEIVFIKYLYGHTIWHILVSVGAYFLTIMFNDIKNKKQYEKYISMIEFNGFITHV